MVDKANMEKEFVPYDRALKLKELGFNEPCFGKIYADGGVNILSYQYRNSDLVDGFTYCASPTFSQAFRWFRGEYNNLSAINHCNRNGWYFVVREIGGTTDPLLKAVSGNSFNTYEEAELACLDQLIEIVKINHNKNE